ncbi:MULTISPECIES: vWA domain-containing protein [Sorangium]|uniref:Secreted protein n=1 Tax=Sorangium cellulosum (strain So ce56) TaxID=448385 RepID=A9GN94_SORC5|nr:vWA domain-containing protein [Sorangium cellulosum]CAN93551.1 putative secreted protein [Sorangium cellulosum So ce56]
MKLLGVAMAVLTVAVVGLGCGSSPSDGGGGEGASSGGSSGAGSGEGGSLDIGGIGPGSSGAGGASPTGGGGACATQTAAASLQPVYLAFAFDVSGSMGKGDKDWHDKALKWDPVVAATKQFFSDPGSEGLTASLSFFPADDDRCSSEIYATPDVPLTPLPSAAFTEAIDAIEPASSDDWRGGTPTAWVMRGTSGFIEAQRRQNPGKYAIVLVTDGYPQGCDEASDTIDAVVADAQAALAEGVPTYVIGVENPPIDGAPDTLDDLHEIAAAGGTEGAVLIDTGDPSQTTAAFRAAVDRIRGASVSCTMAIPLPPDGSTFDKEKVRVLYTSGSSATTELVYDQSCATEGAWRYDEPASPTQIVLCVDACTTVQADMVAKLSVDFTCESVIEVPL